MRLLLRLLLRLRRLLLRLGFSLGLLRLRLPVLPQKREVALCQLRRKFPIPVVRVAPDVERGVVPQLLQVPPVLGHFEHTQAAARRPNTRRQHVHRRQVDGGLEGAWAKAEHDDIRRCTLQLVVRDRKRELRRVVLRHQPGRRPLCLHALTVRPLLPHADARHRRHDACRIEVLRLRVQADWHNDRAAFDVHRVSAQPLHEARRRQVWRHIDAHRRCGERHHSARPCTEQQLWQVVL